ELPEIGHEPGVRVRAQTIFARDFLTEVAKIVFIESTFEERTRIETGRCVSLEKDHVARMLVARRAPEMIEADFVQRRSGCVGRDVTAVLGALTVCGDDHRPRIPAQIRLDATFYRSIAGVLLLLPTRARID